MSEQSGSDGGPDVEWVMRLNVQTGALHCAKYVGGVRVEAYAPVGEGRAAIYAAAIIQGFEPPRGLVRQERPAG